MSAAEAENQKDNQEQNQQGEEDVASCYICETSIADVDVLGEMHTAVLRKPGRKPLTMHCHYFCLLFSCNLQMNGREDEGMRGFMPEDIEKERNRGRSLTCYFCHKSGPTSACCEKACKVAYHLPCALYRTEVLAKLVPESFFDKVCLLTRADWCRPTAGVLRV